MNEALACRKQGKQALVAATIIQKLNDKKMKTPIQQLIDIVGYGAQGLNSDELYDLFMREAKAMLEKEKEVIENAVTQGWDYNEEGLVRGLGEKYYNETFNTKEK